MKKRLLTSLFCLFLLFTLLLTPAQASASAASGALARIHSIEQQNSRCGFQDILKATGRQYPVLPACRKSQDRLRGSRHHLLDADPNEVDFHHRTCGGSSLRRKGCMRICAGRNRRVHSHGRSAPRCFDLTAKPSGLHDEADRFLFSSSGGPLEKPVCFPCRRFSRHRCSKP